MAEYNNNGILFRNRRQRENSRDPDYQGTAKVTCACGRVNDFKLGGWLKDGKKGKFLSLAFSPPKQVEGQKSAEAGEAPEQPKVPF